MRLCEKKILKDTCKGRAPRTQPFPMFAKVSLRQKQGLVHSRRSVNVLQDKVFPKPVLVRLRKWNVDGHCPLVVVCGIDVDRFLGLQDLNCITQTVLKCAHWCTPGTHCKAVRISVWPWKALLSVG